MWVDLENCYIEVVNNDGNKIENGLVFNGSRTILYNNKNEVIDTYVNVIKGDFDNNGKISDEDFTAIWECLVNDCVMDEYQVVSTDINDDGNFHFNDLMLLDKTLEDGYKSISLKNGGMILQTDEVLRMVAEVEPNYGVNLNVKWTSLDEEIVTIDDAGRVTGHNEGSTKIRATTFDGKFMSEASVTVNRTTIDIVSRYLYQLLILGNNLGIK